jgi:hypothetical protein
VPEDAQGELQGGLSAVMNLAMLFGTVFFPMDLRHFMGRRAGLAGVAQRGLSWGARGLVPRRWGCSSCRRDARID